MLDGLRKIGRTWFGKVLGAFLLVGLAGFGISNVILDFGTSTLARVGDEEITIQEFQRAYNDDMSRVSQQIGQTPTPQEAVAMGIPSVTLNRLASEAAIDRMSTQMGLGASDDRLSVMLRNDPTFAGTLGQFDRTIFARALQQGGYTESEYFDLQRKAARRQQLAAGLLADSTVPGAAQELLQRFSGDRRSIDYFIVNAQSIPAVAEPTEEELASYLKDHQDQFRTEETRTVDLMVLSTDTLAATLPPTEEEIAAEYERTKDNRVTAEKRTVRQAPLTAEQVTAFEAGKAAGKTFDQLLAETGANAIDLGTVARSGIVDTALGDAAFGLAQGDFTIIPGAGGQRAVTVTAIEPGGQTTLEEAHDEIARSLAAAAARAEYVDILDQIEELRAAFQPLSDIADRFGLEVSEATLTASGAELADVPAIPEDARARVASEVFDTEEGEFASTISISANNNVWFDLKSVASARDQTLDEVRDEVVAALTAERTDTAIRAEVEKILAKLEAGESFADVAAAENQFPVLSQPMTRNGDGTPVLNQTVANAAFNGGEGHFGSAQNGDGDQVIFQVAEILPADAGPAEQARAYLDTSTRQSLYSQFVAGVRQDVGMRVNQKTLNQVLALDDSGQ